MKNETNRADGTDGAHTPLPERLLTCPVCGIPNFTARGLVAHRCRAKPDRARLTEQELELARGRAA